MESLARRIKLNGRSAFRRLTTRRTAEMQVSVHESLMDLCKRVSLEPRPADKPWPSDEAQRCTSRGVPIVRDKNAPREPAITEAQVTDERRAAERAAECVLPQYKLFMDLFRIERLDELRMCNEVDRVLLPREIGHDSLANMRVYFPCEALPNDDMQKLDRRTMVSMFDPRADAELRPEELEWRNQVRNTLCMDQTCIGLLVPRNADPSSPMFWDYRYVYRRPSGVYMPLTKEMMWWFVLYPMTHLLRIYDMLHSSSHNHKAVLQSQYFTRHVPIVPSAVMLLNPVYETFTITDRREAMDSLTERHERALRRRLEEEDDEPAEYEDYEQQMLESAARVLDGPDADLSGIKPRTLDTRDMPSKRTRSGPPRDVAQFLDLDAFADDEDESHDESGSDERDSDLDSMINDGDPYEDASDHSSDEEFEDWALPLGVKEARALELAEKQLARRRIKKVSRSNVIESDDSEATDGVELFSEHEGESGCESGAKDVVSAPTVAERVPAPALAEDACAMVVAETPAAVAPTPEPPEPAAAPLVATPPVPAEPVTPAAKPPAQAKAPPPPVSIVAPPSECPPKPAQPANPPRPKTSLASWLARKPTKATFPAREPAVAKPKCVDITVARQKPAAAPRAARPTPRAAAQPTAAQHIKLQLRVQWAQLRAPLQNAVRFLDDNNSMFARPAPKTKAAAAGGGLFGAGAKTASGAAKKKRARPITVVKKSAPLEIAGTGVGATSSSSSSSSSSSGASSAGSSKTSAAGDKTPHAASAASASVGKKRKRKAEPPAASDEPDCDAPPPSKRLRGADETRVKSIFDGLEDERKRALECSTHPLKDMKPGDAVKYMQRNLGRLSLYAVVHVPREHVQDVVSDDKAQRETAASEFREFLAHYAGEFVYPNT